MFFRSCAALRRVFGEYRGPTGVGGAATQAAAGGEGEEDSLAPVRARVEALSRRLGRRLKILVGKPGLDGHSNGAEQIAVRARDAGFEVRSGEHTSELQSLMRISYAVFCLKKKKQKKSENQSKKCTENHNY